MKGKLLAWVLLAAAAQVHAQIEKRDVHIAVGGKTALYYLPLTLTERLGFFKDEGLNVRISDFAGGTRSLEAVVGGDRKSTRLNSSHSQISYAVFCLKKKKK